MNTKIIHKKPQKYLGPSQFATALGHSKFKTPELLKQEIEHGYKQEVNSYMTYGINYETRVKQYYIQQTGNRVAKAKWQQHPTCQRLGGFADGILLNAQNEPIGILEIKTHTGRTETLKDIPIYYLIQVAGYMAMYQVQQCDFVSCCINPDTDLITGFNIIHIDWDQVKDQWNNNWFPKLINFVDSIQWQNTI